MILLDANILLYAANRESPFFAEVNDWLEEAFSRRLEIGIPWVSMLAFLRIVTRPILSRGSITMELAVERMEDILAQSNVKLLHPGNETWNIFKALVKEAQVDSNYVTDAHLAALAIEHNAHLCTHDRGFRRFKGLKILDPIKSH